MAPNMIAKSPKMTPTCLYRPDFAKLPLKYHYNPSRRKYSHEAGGRGREVGAPDYLQGVLPQNWDEDELNRSVTCMVLKATANDGRHLALFHEEFRGPLSGLCRSDGISNNNNSSFLRVVVISQLELS
ncbi:uncharacterized protein TNCV_353351 [Trichonephila clavipes]|nr:uncharacterized protein TNCV_353351 [Trichonephila clavipes]